MTTPGGAGGAGTVGTVGGAGTAGADMPPTGLLSNTGALIAGRLVVAAVGWAGTVMIARQLGQTAFGQFTLVFAVLGMLSIVTDLGIGRVALAGVLDPARDRGAFAGSYVVLRAMLGVVGYVLALAFVIVAGYPGEVVRATAVAGLVVLVATPSNGLDIAFQATMRMHWVSFADVVAQFAQLALTIALVLAGGTLAWFAVPAVLYEVVSVAIKLPKAHRLVPLRYAVDPATWWTLLREAVPLSIGTALATVYYRIDSVMLSKLDTFESVGVYGVAFKFVDVAHFVPIALSAPILTVLVRAWPHDTDAFRATLRQGLVLLATAAGLIVVGFCLFARPIIALLYGEAYAAGAGAARILIVAECLGFFSKLAFAGLVAAGAHRRYPVVTLAGLVLNVALNAFLIPAWSYRGAAVATLATEAVVLVLLWAALTRLPGLGRLDLRPLVPVAAAAAAAALVGWAAWSLLPWWAAAGLVVLEYAAVLAALAGRELAGLRRGVELTGRRPAPDLEVPS